MSIENALSSLNTQAQNDWREKLYLARKAALGCFIIAHLQVGYRCPDCKFRGKDCRDITVDDWLEAAKEECNDKQLVTNL